MPAETLPPIHVVLVHGTFARGAAWTQPSRSTLCRRLRDELGDDVTFDAFEWSGENTHRARVLGGKGLAAHLEDLIGYRRDRRIFVIGHSHGGTVITHALRHRPALARALDGVVFLSTPFIQLRRRPHALALASMIGMLLLLLLIAALSYTEDALYALQWPNWAVKLAGLAVYVVLGLGLVAAIYETRPAPADKRNAANKKKKPDEELVARLDVAIERLLAEFSVRNLDRHRTLIVRANADEASAALAWIQAFSRLVGDVVAALLRWVHLVLPWKAVQTVSREQARKGILYWSAWIAAAVGIGYLALLFAVGLLGWLADIVVWLVALFGADLSGWLQREWPALTAAHAQFNAARAAITATMIGLVKAIALGFAAVLALAALSLVAFNRAFGRWFIWTALFVEVSVEAAPPGRWTVHQLEPPDQTKDWESHSGASLAHSLSYEDARAQSIIACWIRHRARAAANDAARAGPPERERRADRVTA
jgi:pimeloyl-ACP methyl ester carboxylesterase